MRDAESDRIVQLYLQQRGYRMTEQAFKTEAQTLGIEEIAFERLGDEDWSIANYILLRHPNESNPRLLHEAYGKLVTWTDQSLDQYRPELKSVLYPLFVHCYLELITRGHQREGQAFFEAYNELHRTRHASEIQKLQGLDAPHWKENDLAVMFRTNKYNLRMCYYSFELLMEFCLEHHYLVLLRLMNQYMNIQVFTGQPQLRTMEDSFSSPSGTALTAAAVADAKKEPVYWGTLEPEIDGRASERGQPAVRSVDPVKRARAQEAAANMPPQDKRLPRPKQREEDLAVEAAALRELRQRVALGPSALPSVCCYTFHNAQDTLSSVAISKDSTLMSAGFSESFIQVYNLKRENLRKLKNGLDLMDIVTGPDTDQSEFMEDTGSSEARLVGHCGPVYATSFSHDNRFLLSCSEDNTTRLWSLETLSNLVVYKGHTYPVWDCDFSPFSFYFATASHDRTARLWSSEHITPLRIFAGHMSDVDSCKFHPNAHYLATGSSDRTGPATRICPVRLWDVQRGDAVRVFTGHAGAVHALAFSPDGRALASAGEDGVIMVWDLGSGKRLRKLVGHRAMVYSLHFSSDGHVLASGGADNTVRLWDAKRFLGLGTGGTGTGVASAAAGAGAGAAAGTAGAVAPAGAAAAGVGAEEERGAEATELLATLRTKSTPIQCVQFTYRNILLAAGAYTPPTQ